MYVSGGTLNTNGFTVKNNRIQAANNQTVEGAGIYATGATVNFNGRGSHDDRDHRQQFGRERRTGRRWGRGSPSPPAALNDNSVISVTNNAITQTANGVGGGVAFFANSSFASRTTR